MKNEHILLKIKANFEEVLQHKSSFAESLWSALLEQHPVDIADFLVELDRDSMQKVFTKLPKELKLQVFEELSDPMKAFSLSFMSEADQVDVLHALSIDELTDLFDYFSDEELKYYLNLLHKRAREKVLSLLKFPPESAGGIMDIEVLSLMEDLTVEKTIKILQRLRPDQEIHRQIYVLNKQNQLVGHINLEDLVLQKPKARLGDFMRRNKLIAQAYQDREEIAKQMVHYNLGTVPVVGSDNLFLGVIPSDTLADVLVEEAGEDVQRMAALAPMKHAYLETPVYKILIARGGVLVVLLLAESLTGSIIDNSKETIGAAGGIALLAFITMLISTGGNTSHQTSALVIQGMSAGELSRANMYRFLRREFLIAFLLSILLGVTAFARAYFMGGISLLSAGVVGLTLGSIVMLAVTLGSGTPLLFKRLNIDPAFAAGPFLATFMDIVGVLIYIILIRAILL